MKCPHCAQEIGGIAMQIQTQRALIGTITLMIATCPECETILNIQVLLEVAYGPRDPGMGGEIIR